MRGLSALLLVMCGTGCTEETTVGEGGACLTTVDCKGELLCFQTMARGNVCMTPCDADTRICDDGTVCLAGASGMRVCYSGGDLELDEVCMDGGDCAEGLVCVDEEGASHCRDACDTRAPRCPAATECVTLTEPAGFCRAP